MTIPQLEIPERLALLGGACLHHERPSATVASSSRPFVGDDQPIRAGVDTVIAH